MAASSTHGVSGVVDAGGVVTSPALDMERVNTNGVVFWPVVAVTVLADVITKAMAEYALAPDGFPVRVAGDGFRLNLVHNPGAAFGMHVGPFSRWVFLVLALAIVRVLWGMYRRTADRDNLRVAALALLIGGAVGNMIDRLRPTGEVVDFLDLGVGPHRWPTFNLADVAVTLGAVLLFRVLWREDAAAAEQR